MAPKTDALVQVTGVKVTPDMHERLLAKSRESGLNVSTLVRFAVLAYLKRSRHDAVSGEMSYDQRLRMRSLLRHLHFSAIALEQIALKLGVDIAQCATFAEEKAAAICAAVDNK